MTFNYSPGFVCCSSADSIVVQQSGSATKEIDGATIATTQLGAALTAQIFADVQKAWPLNTLPDSAQVPDSGALTVAWNGQMSPNISAGSAGIEAALNADAHNVAAAFPSQ